ncbi:MAG: hypothetical protein IJ308_04905 [Clostridia bacterium]|nr:hypothetical protein [Clostridia bacterium]
MSKKKPVVFLILKILAAFFLCVAITGIVFVIVGFGDFENEWKFILGGVLSSLGVFLTFTCGIIGFYPEIAKLSVKMTKHIQAANKEDMTEIASTNAEIQSDAIRTVASAAREGFEGTDGATKFCKHCGALIDGDSRFCKECGKEQ